jgi:hypothetical protein
VGRNSKQKTYGYTLDGTLITEELIAQDVKEAEAGFDLGDGTWTRREVGRPPMGSGPAAVESVRLDPELANALHAHAEKEKRTCSDVIRAALREYLKLPTP